LNASSGNWRYRRLDLPQITVTAAAASTIVTDCDLCRNGEQDRRLYQQQQQQQQQLQQLQQMHQQQQSSSGLRENVLNASQAYKVLYMETPLCSCGRINASNGRASKLGNNKRSALEIFQTGSNHGKKNNRSHRGHRCLGPGPRSGGLGLANGDDGVDPSGSSNSSTKPLKMNRRSNIKAQVKRFKMETKAAKTLGNARSI
jgi:hypothetical protein